MILLLLLLLLLLMMILSLLLLLSLLCNTLYYYYILLCQERLRRLLGSAAFGGAPVDKAGHEALSHEPRTRNMQSRPQPLRALDPADFVPSALTQRAVWQAFPVARRRLIPLLDPRGQGPSQHGSHLWPLLPPLPAARPTKRSRCRSPAWRAPASTAGQACPSARR